MSDHNNIYNIMGRLDALKPQAETVKETAQRIYESVEAKGSVLAGVKAVEANLSEKYMGFKAVEKAAKKGGAENPAAVAASIGRKKYGKTAFQKAAAAGKKMGEGAGDAHGADFFMDMVDNHNGDVRGIAQDLQSSGLHSEIIAFCKWARGQGIADIFQAIKLANKIGLANDDEQETAYEGLIHAERLLGMRDLDEATCNECGMYESQCGCDHEHTNEERETLKTKKGTIYKGGKYGTDYDAGEEGEKKKPKAKDGEKKGRGRPKKDAPAKFDAPKGDIFGRTTGQAPKGKKGTVIKGKGNQDTVDEGRSMFGKALTESVNFKKMMDECDMTADEMLEAINSDIQAYKATGDMTNRLRDFMHLHNHMKKTEMESAPASLAPQMPSGQDVLPQQSTLGKIGSTVKKAFTGPNDDELLARLQQDSQHTTVDEELNELAKLAGITDEGNAFTGKLAHTPKGGEFELDGEEFTDTSNLEESKKTNLADIARLSGIFQEGKDYGDTTYNEPPEYDNTPDEEVMGVEVLTKGGDGEVAGKEKAMHPTKSTWKNADNALAETKAMLKPAAEFNYVKEMGRDLMKAYEGIKTK